MLLDNIANYYRKFGPLGLNLAYEGLLLENELKVSQRLSKTIQNG
jgi:hypothetical protein